MRLALIALLTIGFIGCSNSEKPVAQIEKADGHKHGGPIAVEKVFAGKYPINIVCTTGMVADLARNIGGDKVKVKQLMGAGVDPPVMSTC